MSRFSEFPACVVLLSVILILHYLIQPHLKILQIGSLYSSAESTIAKTVDASRDVIFNISLITLRMFKVSSIKMM